MTTDPYAAYYLHRAEFAERRRRAAEARVARALVARARADHPTPWARLAAWRPRRITRRPLLPAAGERQDCVTC